jgi:hypothetical protein
MSSVVIACIASICVLNLSIGAYIGRRGSRWFVGVGPGALLLMFLGVGVIYLLRYAQDSYGYHATLKHIVFTLTFALVGYIGGRVLRGRHEQK